MKDMRTMSSKESHMYALAYILTSYSRVVRSFLQQWLSQHISYVFYPQLLETGSCIGYLDVIICDNSSLHGTPPKPPRCISAQNCSPFAHDCFPYQTCSKQLTLGRKRAHGCLYTGDSQRFSSPSQPG